MLRKTSSILFVMLLGLVAVVPAFADQPDNVGGGLGNKAPDFSAGVYADGETWGTKGTTSLPAPNDDNQQSWRCRAPSLHRQKLYDIISSLETVCLDGGVCGHSFLWEKHCGAAVESLPAQIPGKQPGLGTRCWPCSTRLVHRPSYCRPRVAVLPARPLFPQIDPIAHQSPRSRTWPRNENPIATLVCSS
jgi:hypothetical protein